MNIENNNLNKQELVISEINYSKFIPLGITQEEVMANALKDAELLKGETTINDIPATSLCNSYLEKKANYKQLTKLGNLLVKNKVITLNQLKAALNAQNEKPDLKLGNILISMGACTKHDIEKCIKSQNQIRDEIKKIDDYEDSISLLRKKLNT